MSYDYRTSNQAPMYRNSTSSSSPATHPVYGSSMYPRVSQSGPPSVAPPPLRPAPSPSPYHQSQPPQSSPGLGIRVAIKPEYRITPPPHMLPQVGDIPRSNFQFDFEVERRILAEAEKESQNWGRLGLENLASRNSDSTSSTGSGADPVVSKYIASGLSREAVPLAVQHYGDDPTKVQKFVNSYTLLREMGFSSSSVSEALVMYDNDTDKALAHFLNSSS